MPAAAAGRSVVSSSFLWVSGCFSAAVESVLMAAQGVSSRMAVEGFVDHSVPPNTILWADLVNRAVIALSLFHSEDLVLPVGQNLSSASSGSEISDKDPIAWLEVSA